MFESLYIHIPFCKQRCLYCNFTTESVPSHDPGIDAYLEQLITDIRRVARSGQFECLRTLYIGGGTPTYIGHGRLVELAYTISLSINLEQVEEYTVEANPESLTVELVRDLYALGVNRLSLGVQSLVDSELVVLGRAHDAAKAVQAIKEARERFDNISLDLICGIPGQTASSWQLSLERALELEPEHLSIYPLQVEEGTPLQKAIACGELLAVDEDEQADLLEQAAGMLRKAGYHRYEVASYARRGRESRHNSRYWTGVSYLGLGKGAASMKNHANGTRERWIEGGEKEILTAREAAAEDLFLAMRMSCGISIEQLKEVTHLLPQAQKLFSELLELGLVTSQEMRYLPTEKGWLLGNELYSRIWDLATVD